MARKKSNTKLVAIGGLSLVVVVGLVGVFVLYPNILQEDVITTTSTEEIIQNGIDQGLFTVPIPCFEITDCMDGQPIISEEHDTNPIEEVINPTPTINDPVEPELEAIIVEPPPDSSQVCPPICGGDEQIEIPIDPIKLEPIIEEPAPIPPTIQIVSNVTKIANNGERFSSSTSFDVPLRLELFVEDTTNIDFDQGFIENQLFIKTDPNLNIELNGLFNIMIDNQTILTNPVPINVQGISDQDGMIVIDFISPTGIPSEIFLFQFADNIDKFDTQGITKIEYELTAVTVDVNEFSYELDSGTIFSMDIFRDPNLILISNEVGGELRVFPSDDRVRLCSSAGKYTSKTCSVHSDLTPFFEIFSYSIYEILKKTHSFTIGI